jgi:hypothetical protein
VSVPPWAERTGRTSWHPQHVAERYVVVYLLLLKPLHGALWDEPATVPPAMLVTSAATLALAGLPALGVPVALSVLLLSLPLAGLVAAEVAGRPVSRGRARAVRSR